MFGEFLVLKGVIDSETLKNALKHQLNEGKMLGETLVDLGVMNKESINYYLNEHLIFRTQEIIDEHRDNA